MATKAYLTDDKIKEIIKAALHPNKYCDDNYLKDVMHLNGKVRKGQIRSCLNEMKKAKVVFSFSSWEGKSARWALINEHNMKEYESTLPPVYVHAQVDLENWKEKTKTTRDVYLKFTNEPMYNRHKGDNFNYLGVLFGLFTDMVKDSFKLLKKCDTKAKLNIPDDDDDLNSFYENRLKDVSNLHYEDNK